MSEATAFVLTHESDANRTGYSASLQALALTRSLGRRGVRVVRLHPNTRELSLLSRYCSATEVCPNIHGAEAELVRFLLSLDAKYPAPRVLIPATDDAAFFLGQHRESLLEKFNIPAPSRAMIDRIINKRFQYEDAQQVGIPIPETYFPQNTAEVRRLAAEVRGYPYVIKPNVAHRWRLSSVKQKLSSAPGTTVKGVPVHNAEQLIAEYERISQGDTDVMIQEVIGGKDELLYTFLGYFDAQSKPLGYCVRSKIRQYPLNFGYCTMTVTCENDVVVRQSIRLLQNLRYHGIVGVEWKHDPKTDQYKLIEINARAVNTSAIAPACGVDLPYIAFSDAIGQPAEPVTRWESGVKWVWITQDIWAARQLARLKQMTLRGWLRSLRGKRVHPVYALDDLKPVIVYLGGFIAANFPAFAGKLLSRLGLRRP